MRQTREPRERPDAQGAGSDSRPGPPEEALRLLAERFAGIFWTTDENLRLTSASGAGIEAIGRTPDQLVGQTLHGLLGAEQDHEPIAVHLRALQGERGAYTFTAGGRDLHARVEPLQASDGSVVGVVGMAVDVTDVKQAERWQSKLAQIVEASDDAIIGFSLDGTIITWNAGAERLYGYAPTELVGQPLSILVPADRLEELPSMFYRLEQGEPLHFETERLRKDGRRIDVSLSVSPIRDSEGRVTAASVIARDVTARKRAEQALRESEARKTAILDSALDCIITMDHEGRILEFNPAAEQVFGYPRADAVGREMAELIIPESLREAHRSGLRRLIETGQPTIAGRRLETTALRADGSEFPIELAVMQVRVAGRPPVFTGYLRDITDRKKAEADVAFLAYHDKLTGLPNRAMFEQHLELGLARARRDEHAVAVLFLDLDNFKLVNDSLGHTAGDKLLLEVATRLRQAARETDLVGRQGGDEFLLLLADLPRRATGDEPEPVETAEAVAARIHEALQRPFTVDDTELFVSASVGIGVWPIHADDQGDLLRIADTAMYQSKKAGPGSTMVFAGESADVRGQLSLATELRRAVRERQWALHYQPIVDLATGEMVAAEALLRWLHPSGTVLLPDRFLALAEEMGFSDEIEEWVLQESTRDAERWRAAGLDVVLTINVSPRRLWRPELARSIPQQLDAVGFDPKGLIVEVTESATMTDPQRSMDVLRALHERGVGVAIDDFGTGYSSLARLRDMPVQILKIDRSFVNGITRDAADATMVAAMITLARNLGMEPVAEGIETEEQRAFLIAHGCRTGQGFLLSRPIPAVHLQSGYAAAPGGLTAAG